MIKLCVCVLACLSPHICDFGQVSYNFNELYAQIVKVKNLCSYKNKRMAKKGEKE